MFFKTTTSAMALSALLVGPSFADVSPADVWQSWVEYYTGTGMTVTEGSREENGGSLVVRDLVMGFADDNGKFEVKVPSVTMEDIGGGKVRVTMAPEITAEMNVIAPKDTAEGAPAGGDLSLGVAMTQTNSEMVVSGTPDDQLYDVSMPEFVMTLDKVVADGKTLDMPLSARIADTKGSYRHTKTAEGRRVVQDLKTGKVEFSGKGTIPQPPVEGQPESTGPDSFDFTGSYDGLAMAFDMTLPPDVNMENLDVALKAGMAMTGNFEFGKSEMNGTMSGPNPEGPDAPAQTVTFKTTGDSGKLGFLMSQDGIGYNGTAGATAVEMTMNMLPFPIKYGIESTAIDFLLPVSAREEAQPYKLSMKIAGLTMGDEIWGLFDPMAQLPRDPATIDIDISGNAKVLENILDPEYIAEQSSIAEGTGADDAGMDTGASMPFLPLDVKLSKILIHAIGAKAEASGQLAAREGATLQEPPVGTVSVRLEGINVAMDKLINLGLLNPESAMQARMMMGMMTRPVEGATDTQTSEVEFKDDGSVFVNGQQMQ